MREVGTAPQHTGAGAVLGLCLSVRLLALLVDGPPVEEGRHEPLLLLG
jgi:hypothetical protein